MIDTMKEMTVKELQDRLQYIEETLHGLALMHFSLMHKLGISEESLRSEAEKVMKETPKISPTFN